MHFFVHVPIGKQGHTAVFTHTSAVPATIDSTVCCPASTLLYCFFFSCLVVFCVCSLCWAIVLEECSFISPCIVYVVEKTKT